MNIVDIHDQSKKTWTTSVYTKSMCACWVCHDKCVAVCLGVCICVCVGCVMTNVCIPLTL